LQYIILTKSNVAKRRGDMVRYNIEANTDDNIVDNTDNNTETYE
jgi:hypothetical protein